MQRLAILLTLPLFTACSLYGDDEGADPGPDAAVVVDGAEACEPTPDRNVSCRTICSADIELCAGADWTVCFAECRTGVAAGAWCPGGA